MDDAYFALLSMLIGTIAFCAAAIWLGQRMLRGDGESRPATGMADAFGNLIDVFHPGHARAMRDLKQHDDAGPVIPSPDDEDDLPVRVVTDATGRPVSARIRRSRLKPRE